MALQAILVLLFLKIVLFSKMMAVTLAAKVAEAEKKGQLDAFFTAFSETIRDPGLLTNFLAEQAPQLIPSLGVARIIKPLAGTATAVRGAVSTGAVQQAADIAAGTYEQVYKALVDKGTPETQAAGEAIGYARATGASALVISLLAQRLPGAKAIEEAFAGQEGRLGRVLGGLKGAAGEGISELAEETPAKFLQNLALQQVAPETSLTAGLGETAAMAALGGAGLGGATGLLQRQARPEEAPARPEWRDGSCELHTTCFEWQSCCLRGQYDGGIWASEPIPTLSNDVLHGLLFDFNPKIIMIRQRYF